MHRRDLMKTMMGTMTKQMHQMVHHMAKTHPNLPSESKARMEKTTDDMRKDFPGEEYLQAVTPVYQKHLTKGDVDALVAFYKSPTGQKSVKELPVIQGEALQASSRILQRIMMKVMDRVQAEVAQAQKPRDADSKKKTQQN